MKERGEGEGEGEGEVGRGEVYGIRTPWVRRLTCVSFSLVLFFTHRLHTLTPFNSDHLTFPLGPSCVC